MYFSTSNIKVLIDWLFDCCSTSSEQYFSCIYIHDENKLTNNKSWR